MNQVDLKVPQGAAVILYLSGRIHPTQTLHLDSSLTICFFVITYIKTFTILFLIWMSKGTFCLLISPLFTNLSVPENSLFFHLQDTGRELMPTDIKLYQMFGGEKVCKI